MQLIGNKILNETLHNVHYNQMLIIYGNEFYVKKITIIYFKEI